jgi:hypothetical protein
MVLLLLLHHLLFQLRIFLACQACAAGSAWSLSAHHLLLLLPWVGGRACAAALGPQPYRSHQQLTPALLLFQQQQQQL